LISLVYGVSINDITNNDVVLALACALSDNLMLPHSYITDAYGGYCGVPSTSIPAATNVTTTADTTTNATTNTTNSSSSARALSSTTYELDFYI